MASAASCALLLLALTGSLAAASASDPRQQTLKLHQPWHSVASFTAYTPTSPTTDAPMPLVLMLSGYCLPGDTQDNMQLRYKNLVNEMQFAYVPLKSPRSTRTCALCPTTIKAASQASDMPLYGPGARLTAAATAAGQCTAWDATSACCVPESAGHDGGDIPFLQSVVNVTAAAISIDPMRIYVVGIANGGFMALRLACERAGAAFAGIVAYAAGVFASECSAAAKVPLLLVQGNKDVIVPFGGGINSAGVAFPGFRESTQIWASSNGCSGPQLSSFTATGSNNNHLRIDDTKYTNCSVPFESWEIEQGQHFALPDTSAVIFQKALREFLWPRRRA